MLHNFANVNLKMLQLLKGLILYSCQYLKCTENIVSVSIEFTEPNRPKVMYLRRAIIGSMCVHVGEGKSRVSISQVTVLVHIYGI